MSPETIKAQSDLTFHWAHLDGPGANFLHADNEDRLDAQADLRLFFGRTSEVKFSHGATRMQIKNFKKVKPMKKQNTVYVFMPCSVPLRCYLQCSSSSRDICRCAWPQARCSGVRPCASFISIGAFR